MERALMGVAHALFMNRLHLLRLTEVVRLGITPDQDGIMELPPELDLEVQQQAYDYVTTCFPQEFSALLAEVKADWIRLT